MSVTQFVKAALIGTDGEYVVLSPVSEGVDGASRTIFVTEAGEEVKVEDDQTVLTSVKNTITIIATVLDADIAKINSWLTNDISVGFAGYTIGGIVYAPAINAEDNNFELELRNGNNTATLANRGDAFSISAIQRVSEIKHTWRIVLSQICLQSYNPVTALKYGAQPNVNMLSGTTIGDKFSETKSVSTTLPYHSFFAGSSTFQNNTTVIPIGTGYRLSTNNVAGGQMINKLFFPFTGTLALNATGNAGSASGYTGSQITLINFDASGVANTSNSFSLASTASSTGSATLTNLAGTDVFVGFYIQKNDAANAGLININDIKLTFSQ